MLHYTYTDTNGTLSAFCGARENSGITFNTTCTYDDVTCTACRQEVGR